jgi:hypothetical protein
MFCFTFSLGSFAQRANIMFKETDRYQETVITAFDKYLFHTPTGRYQYSQVDTIRFIDPAPVKLLASFNQYQIPFFNSLGNEGSLKPADYSRSSLPDGNFAKRKKSANRLKGFGILLISTGYAIYSIDPIITTNSSTVNGATTVSMVMENKAERNFGRILMATGGLFVFAGFALDPVE